MGKLKLINHDIMSKKSIEGTNALSNLMLLEVDSEINRDNYKDAGIPLLNYDEQLLTRLVGSDYGLLPHKKNAQSERNKLAAKERLYNSNIWVSKENYKHISRIINGYKVSLTPDTITLAVLIIEKTYLRLELLKEYSAKKTQLSEEQNSIVEIGKFSEIMREIADSNPKHCQIDIFINNKNVLVSDGNIIMKEILKWYFSYYNKDRAEQYFYDFLRYKNVKNKVMPTSNIYIFEMSDFKKMTCKLLHNSLHLFFEKPADCINFIAEVLAVRNIFGLEKMKSKSKYDTVFRAITSEYRNI